MGNSLECVSHGGALWERSGTQAKCKRIQGMISAEYIMHTHPTQDGSIQVSLPWVRVWAGTWVRSRGGVGGYVLRILGSDRQILVLHNFEICARQRMLSRKPSENRQTKVRSRAREKLCSKARTMPIILCLTNCVHLVPSHCQFWLDKRKRNQSWRWQLLPSGRHFR